jgi:outer membrane protein assembly factor BamB
MPDRWTDAELVQFCLDGPFDEISDELIVALRERIAESNTVRDAVGESPQSDELLNRLGMTRNQLIPPPRRSPAVALLLLLCVAVGVVAYIFGSQQGQDQAGNDSDSQDPAGKGESDSGDNSEVEVASTEKGSTEKNLTETPETAPAEVETTEPPTKPGEVEPAETAVTEAKPEAAQDVPWANLLSPDVASFRVEDVAWKAPGEGRIDEFPPTEFRRWFSAIPGRPWQVSDETQRNLKYTRFDGQARLNAPWVADAVLRLAIYDAERCSLFFWRGNTGVRLRYYRNRSPHQFAAHRVTRNGPKSTPEIGQLITHDNGRWQRSFFGPFEIRQEHGQLMLVRGDLPFLRVGFDGPPDEVIVDGKLKVRHCTMYRSDPLPQKQLARFELPQGENQLASSQPGRLEWSLLGEGSKTAEIKLDSDSGTIEVRAGASDTGDAVTVTPVSRTGLCEIVCRVARADPGTGLVLMHDGGTPMFRVGFEWDSNGSRLAVATQAPTAGLVERAFDRNAWPVAWTANDQWLRMVIGAGTMSLWTSEDGENWGWVGDSTTRGATPPLTGVGIFALKGTDRGITVSHLELRQFPTLNSLADQDLRTRVNVDSFGPAALLDIGTWMQHVIQSQPKDVEDFEAWRQACAVETLRVGSNSTVAAALLNGLLTETLIRTDVVSGRGKLDRRFLWRLLGEASQTLDVFDGTMGLRFSHVVHEAVRRRALNGLAEVSLLKTDTRVAEPALIAADSADAILPAGSVTADGMAEFLMMRFWSQQATLLTPQNAAQLELLSLVQRREDERVRQLLDRLTFWNSNCHPAQAWWTPLSASYSTMAWAELTSQRTLDSDQQLARVWPGRWKTALTPIRHPLAQTVSKEAYNVMAEFQAAISGRAFADACQVISSTATSELLGLLPDTQDDRLLVSFSNAVALAMDRHPELRSSMNEKFGAVGRLRVRQAIENGDSDSIEAASVQFFGTLAAAESEQWLGDQALAAGRFAAARGHYRAALAGFQQNLAVETAETASLRSRLDMTSAILGLAPDSPAEPAPAEAAPARPVNFAGVKLTPAQFTELTVELRASGSATATAAGTHGAKAASSAWHIGDRVPPPGGYELVKKSQIDGDVGEHAGRSAPADVNWFARQTAVEVDGAEAFLCNRFQLTRIDLNTGLPTWKQELGGDHGSVNYWPHLAMRPLLTASRVFCRRLTKTGPELICCDRASGNVLWRFHPKTLLVSDPLLIRDRLQIFSLTTDATGPGLLRLLTVDATRGIVTDDVEVLRLFADSSLPAHLCLATVDDDRIFFSVSGSVACCDSHGQCVWVRQQSWTPPILDPMRRIRAWQPPLIHGETVLVSQPGIDGVDCLDRTSGRILWSRMVPGLKRVVGLVGPQLLVERRDGLESLAADDGRSLWQYHTTTLMDAVLAGPPLDVEIKVAAGDPPVEKMPPEPQWILVTQWKQLPKKIMEARLVWLDPETGRAVSEQPLTELNSREVAIGPFLTSGERVWLYGTQSRKEARRILYELVKTDVRQPTPLIDESWAAWMPEFRRSTFYPNGTYAEPHFTRTAVAAALLDGTRSVTPGWLVQAAPQPKEGGFRPEVLGQKNVLALRLNARKLTEPQLEQTSKVPADAVRLFRKVTIPDSPGARLSFRVGHEPKQNWKLSICHGSCRLHSSIIDDATAPGGWQTVNVDLSEYAGKTIHLVITCSAATYPSQNWVYLQGPGDAVP